MPDLNQQLEQLRTRLSASLFVEGSRVFDHDLSITPNGGAEALCAIAQAVQPKVVFYYFFTLSESDFNILPLEPADDDGLPLRPAIDVQHNPRMQPFKAYIGQPLSLTLYVLYEGHQITVTEFADWHTAFQSACEQAYEEEVQRHEARSKERQDQRLQKMQAARHALVKDLEEQLPKDLEFVRFACEARPRVSDLYRAAERVAGEERWNEYGSGLVMSDVRRIAAEIKAAAREARKRK